MASAGLSYPPVVSGYAFIFALIAGLSSDTLHAEQDTAPRPVDSAVIRIEVPLLRQKGGSRLHVIEDCSGTLVNKNTGLIITAWHCFDGAMDLTRPARARIDGEWLSLDLKATGGSMEEDWALVQATHTATTMSQAMPISFAPTATGDTVTMLGYTLSPNSSLRSLVRTTCRVTDTGFYWVETDCRLEKGTSGGAVIRGEGSTATVIGIVSARKSDGSVLFIPLTRLQHYLSPP